MTPIIDEHEFISSFPPVSYTHLDVYKRQEYKSTPLHRLPPNFAQVTFGTRQKVLPNLEFDILPRSHDLGPFNYAFSLKRIKMSTPWRPELNTIVTSE